MHDDGGPVPWVGAGPPFCLQVLTGPVGRRTVQDMPPKTSAALLARLSTRTIRGLLAGTATANTDGDIWVGQGLPERLQGDEHDAMHVLIADEHVLLGDFAPWSDIADLTLALDVIGAARDAAGQS